MSGVFQQTAPARPGRSVFNLSYNKKLTCDMGQLIPIMCDEVVPGDVFKIGNQAVVRFQPLIAPIMHEVNVFVHYFFVPYRILWKDWETFITGGVDGNDTTAVLPRWAPQVTPIVGSLWDYMGLPLVIPTGRTPLDFPRRAYFSIWNEYYRDETLQTKVDFAPAGSDSYGVIKQRCWEKDYFTSALPWQQRGTAPSLPISGTTSAVFNADATGTLRVTIGGTDTQAYGMYNAPNSGVSFSPTPAGNGNNPLRPIITAASLANNTVDLSSATTFDVADLRLVFQIQKWMERNARGGARYTEFLRSHFAVSPRDDRLQRPEYIGGSKSPVIISEVLQTSEPTASSPQANMAGHGISVNQSFCANYRATEYGLIMGIMSIMPRSAYSQGIDRQWLRQTKYDFYFPEFANLSEQAIERCEIYATNVEAENKTLFGYQGRYDELRFKRNQVCGLMRTSLNYWHLGREFASPPLLNSTFVECNPSKRIFAVQNEPGLIVNFGNLIKAIRPMPVQSNPGLLDH